MFFNAIKFLSDPYINNIISKKIHVLYSHNTDFILAEDFLTKAYVWAKESTDYRYKTTILRDGNHFNLIINDSYVCKSNEELKRCENPTKFSLISSKFGYKIAYGSKCLTVGPTAYFTLCSPKNQKQDLIFEDKTNSYKKSELLHPNYLKSPNPLKIQAASSAETIADKSPIVMRKTLQSGSINNEEIKRITGKKRRLMILLLI